MKIMQKWCKDLAKSCKGSCKLMHISSCKFGTIILTISCKVTMFIEQASIPWCREIILWFCKGPVWYYMEICMDLHIAPRLNFSNHAMVKIMQWPKYLQKYLQKTLPKANSNKLTFAGMDECTEQLENLHVHLWLASRHLFRDQSKMQIMNNIRSIFHTKSIRIDMVNVPCVFVL